MRKFTNAAFAVLMALLLMPGIAHSEDYVDRIPYAVSNMIARCVKDPQSWFADKIVKYDDHFQTSLTQPRSQTLRASGVNSTGWVFGKFQWKPKTEPQSEWQDASLTFYIYLKEGALFFSKGFDAKECVYSQELSHVEVPVQVPESAATLEPAPKTAPAGQPAKSGKLRHPHVNKQAVKQKPVQEYP